MVKEGRAWTTEVTYTRDLKLDQAEIKQIHSMFTPLLITFNRFLSHFQPHFLVILNACLMHFEIVFVAPVPSIAQRSS